MTASFRGLLMLADDGPTWKWDPVEQAQAACDGGARAVQLRAKHATDSVALGWARSIRALTHRCGAVFYVNDRFDLALVAQADGVHLGQDDLPPTAIPAQARARLSLGLSTHDAAQVAAARREPVDYIAYGPVFGTRSKVSEYAARGLEALAETVQRSAPRPVVAIGGIDSTNAAQVAAAGATAIAVVSAVAAAADPVAAARSLVAAFAEGSQK